MSVQNYEVVSPASEQHDKSFVASDFNGDFRGRRVGLIWDGLYRGDYIYQEIVAVLSRRFAGVEIVGYEQFGNIHGSDEAKVMAELPKRLYDHRIDVAIVGIAA